MKFRKNNTVVDAVQFSPETPIDGVHELAPSSEPYEYETHYLETPDGNLLLYKGHWIITDDQGKKSVCDPDTFAMEYEPAADVSEVAADPDRHFDSLYSKAATAVCGTCNHTTKHPVIVMGVDTQETYCRKCARPIYPTVAVGVSDDELNQDYVIV